MQTLSIAICEDSDTDAAELHRVIPQSGISADVHTYNSTSAFLDAFRPGAYQLIFFDVYFAGIDGSTRAEGHTTAKTVRESDSEVWLVFVTSSPDFAIFGYTVNADRYVLKPPDEHEILALLERAVAHFSERSDDLTVTVDRKHRSIRLCDIKYIEASNKQSVIYLQDEAVTTYTPIDELEKQLRLPSFMRCHRSFIVNMDHIESAERDFTMRGGGMAYISHSNQWKVRRAYRDYITRLARVRSTAG